MSDAIAWRPIETAPRDGTIIDLWMRSFFWNADGEKQLSVEKRIPAAMWFDQQWTNADGNLHEDLEGFEHAEITHWSPILGAP